MQKKLLLLLMALLMVLQLCPASAESELDAYDSPDVIIGIPTGAAAMSAAEARFPNAKKQYLTSDNDGYISVLSGRITAYAYDAVILKYACEENPGLRLLDETFGQTDISVGISKKREDLLAPINAFIEELISSGVRDEMLKRWLLGAYTAEQKIDEPEAPEMTIRVGTSGSVVPMTYYGADQSLTGFDIELLERLGLKLNAKIEISVMNYDSLVAGLESGKLDIVVANLNITPERAERIIYSEPYMTASTGLVVKNNASTETAVFSSTEDYQRYFTSGKKLGVTTGTIFDVMSSELFPDAQLLHYNTASDLIVALNAGKIDGYLVDGPMGYSQCLINDTLWMPDVIIKDDNYGIALALGNDELCAQMNEIIKKYRADGTLDALNEKWFTTDEAKKPAADIKLTGEKGVLRLATDGDSYPFSYVRDGETVGQSIELFKMICAELGYGVEIQLGDFSAVITAVASGKADAAASSISITEERKEQMLFTEPTYIGGVKMILPASVKPAADLTTVAGVHEWIRGKHVGLYIGATISDSTNEMLKDSEKIWHNNNADMVTALKSGKIDCFLCEEPIAVSICRETEGLYTPKTLVYAEDYAYALGQGSEKLLEQLNSTIQRLTDDGTLEKLRQKWTTGEASDIKMPDITLSGENGTLRIATDAEDAPFGYIVNGEMIGYDYEVLALFAEEFGYKLEYDRVDWDALPAAVSSDKYDIACGCLALTDEHEEALLMSLPTFSSGVTIVVTDKYASAQGEGEELSGIAAFWASVSASFERTFIRESRWKLILQGLLTTLLISVLSAVLGTILGFIVCLARRSRLRLLSGVAKVFIQIMQGTPIVVFLMILYYIIFGDVEPVLVAVIGFALNFAAYVSEMMRTGIDAVDKGQIEAASALGFTKTRAFMLITLPQAARHFLPVFRGEFISLVKMTSVVGYISIMDLTKMSDVIRSRTYEAFFPLIATAVIYFLLSWLLAQSLNAIELRIDPKRRKRVVKGVREEEKAQ